MSENDGNSVIERLEDSRREFMKKSAVAAASAGVVASGAGAAAAQDDGDGFDFEDAGGEALTLIDNFHPFGRFVFVSGVVNWTPRLPDVRDSIWNDYNTYQIQWLGTNEIVPLWVTEDANVGTFDEDFGFVPDLTEDIERPQAWEMERDWSPLGDNERLTSVEFEPVDEDVEDEILDNDPWWGTD